MDPTIVQQRLHVNDKQEDKDPDPEHLDEDNSIMGIDDNPPLGNTTISKHFIALSYVSSFCYTKRSGLRIKWAIYAFHF